MIGTRGWSLQHDEYTVLWRRLGLGDKPVLLNTPDHGATLSERDVIDGWAWERLRGRGLVDRGRVVPDLADTLAALARPSVQADLRLRSGPDRERRVLACASGMVGAVAEATPAGVDVQAVPPSGLAEGLLRALPVRPAVRGNAILMPGELLRNGLSVEGALSRLDAAGMRAGESRPLVDFLGSRMLRQAKIGAAARDRAGRLLRSPTVLTVLDTEAGRAVLRPQRGGTLFMPADHERLRQQIDELIRVAVSATPGR